MFLATYGKKCNVPFEKVKKDILEFVPRMDTVIGKTEQHFTKQNALDTLNAYKESDKTTLPIKIISDHTELQIMRNKRNKRNTMNHFEKARAVQEKDYPNGSWRNEDGRSEATAENTEHYTKVQEWRKKDPNSSNKSLCARETSLSRTTSPQVVEQYSDLKLVKFTLLC